MNRITGIAITAATVALTSDGIGDELLSRLRFMEDHYCGKSPVQTNLREQITTLLDSPRYGLFLGAVPAADVCTAPA